MNFLVNSPILPNKGFGMRKNQTKNMKLEALMINVIFLKLDKYGSMVIFSSPAGALTKIKSSGLRANGISRPLIRM